MDGSRLHSKQGVGERTAKGINAKVACSITLATSGQVVLCVPRIVQDSKYAQRLQTLLEAEPRVVSQQFNPITGSVVINYNLPGRSDTEIRSQLVSLIESSGDQDVLIEQPVISPEPQPVEDSQAVISPEPQPVEDSLTTEESPMVTYSVVHAIPGRVRFYVPQIASNPNYVQRLEALLKGDPAITSERVNQYAASVVITYKKSLFRDTQTKKDDVWEAAVPHLVNLLQSANN
jgi:hypothetical protein